MRGWTARFGAGMAALALLSGWALPARADVIVVGVNSNFFSPNEISVATGDTVAWRVNSGVHTTTSSDGLWDSGLISAGDEFDYTFTASGDYPYICTLHADCCNMVGIIHVVDPVVLQGTLAPTGIDPGASGTANFTMVPYRSTLDVTVQGILSTNAVDVFVNNQNLVGSIVLDGSGSGALHLNTDNGDIVPNLQAGDEIEIYDAVDDMTLILVGTVQ